MLSVRQQMQRKIRKNNFLVVFKKIALFRPDIRPEHLEECSFIKKGDVTRIENLSIGGNIFEFLESIECVSKEVV